LCDKEASARPQGRLGRCTKIGRDWPDIAVFLPLSETTPFSRTGDDQENPSL